VLHDAASIRRRIAELAQAVARDYAAGHRELTVVSVIEGARPFTRRLLEELPFDASDECSALRNLNAMVGRLAD
jgi:hypoxanthine-guanine phosphoribosyltransferase